MRCRAVIIRAKHLWKKTATASYVAAALLSSLIRSYFITRRLSMNFKATIATFLSEEFAPDIPPEEFDENLNLVDFGIIDSLGVLKLVAYLESDFGIVVQPEELSVDLFSSLGEISRFVDRKLEAVR
ncbi:acyl carrier protein [Jejubacter calystegiae]|uniref:Acyl carrier protein n=2 Tax=Jejubacter calystegiae TaxID=2579935 RepID=A0A4P8YK22_9ENTR|nr:acyl carrier protein [Jejubacter calystegiae]